MDYSTISPLVAACDNDGLITELVPEELLIKGGDDFINAKRP